MARLESTANICDRHMGAQVVATVSRTFTIDGRRYRFDACAEHDRLFDLNLGPWVRCATEEALVDTSSAPTPSDRAPVRPAPALVVATREVEVEPDLPIAP